MCVVLCGVYEFDANTFTTRLIQNSFVELEFVYIFISHIYLAVDCRPKWNDKAPLGFGNSVRYMLIFCAVSCMNLSLSPSFSCICSISPFSIFSMLLWYQRFIKSPSTSIEHIVCSVHAFGIYGAACMETKEKKPIWGATHVDVISCGQ